MGKHHAQCIFYPFYPPLIQYISYLNTEDNQITQSEATLANKANMLSIVPLGQSYTQHHSEHSHCLEWSHHSAWRNTHIAHKTFIAQNAHIAWYTPISQNAQKAWVAQKVCISRNACISLSQYAHISQNASRHVTVKQSRQKGYLIWVGKQLIIKRTNIQIMFALSRWQPKAEAKKKQQLDLLTNTLDNELQMLEYFLIYNFITKSVSGTSF